MIIEVCGVKPENWADTLQVRGSALTAALQGREQRREHIQSRHPGTAMARQGTMCEGLQKK